jgi:DNA-binding MarR family transcriptional regulator
MSNRPSAGDGRFEYAGLDRLLHERARLGIVTSLAAHPAGLPFTALKRLCNLTDGNLSRHLTVLQDAGLVAIRKGFDHRRPLTLARLTAAGRERFTAYLAELEKVVADAAAATAARPLRRPAWAPESSS